MKKSYKFQQKNPPTPPPPKKTTAPKPTTIDSLSQSANNSKIVDYCRDWCSLIMAATLRMTTDCVCERASVHMLHEVVHN